MERANKEMEVLRKQYEAMSQELKEVTQEAEVAKCRRDWAFQERDKIVAERESIRYTNGAIEKRFLACFVVLPVDSLGWFGFVWCLVGKCSKMTLPNLPLTHTHSLTLLRFSFPRTLCDNLRRERDRAVSDLADALRNLDDMRKQKNDASRELKELK